MSKVALTTSLRRYVCLCRCELVVRLDYALTSKIPPLKHPIIDSYDLLTFKIGTSSSLPPSVHENNNDDEKRAGGQNDQRNEPVGAINRGLASLTCKYTIVKWLNKTFRQGEPGVAILAFAFTKSATCVCIHDILRNLLIL